jgi:hypothetical protein
MPKLLLTDSTDDMITKMADGNPGAVSAVFQLITEAGSIDPQDFMGVGMVLHLDHLQLYGGDIYVIWNDVCDRDARKFRLLLRASQLGLVDHGTMTDLTEGHGIADWGVLDTGVCEKLDRFQKKDNA